MEQLLFSVCKGLLVRVVDGQLNPLKKSSRLNKSAPMRKDAVQIATSDQFCKIWYGHRDSRDKTTSGQSKIISEIWRRVIFTSPLISVFWEFSPLGVLCNSSVRMQKNATIDTLTNWKQKWLSDTTFIFKRLFRAVLIFNTESLKAVHFQKYHPMGRSVNGQTKSYWQLLSWMDGLLENLHL